MEIKRNKRKSHTLNISLDFQPPIGISAKYQYLCQKPNSTTAMKTKLWIGIFLLGVCLSLPLHAQQTHRTSGWYHLYASPTDSIGQTPIVTLKDCAALELNTDPYGHYTIIGQVKQYTDRPARQCPHHRRKVPDIQPAQRTASRPLPGDATGNGRTSHQSGT